MLQQLHEMPEMGSKGHRGWSWDGGRGGNLKGEEAVGTRGQTEGSSALWVGKRVGSQDSRRVACTVLLQSTALHSITVGAWDLREGTNKWMGMVFVSPPTHTL